MILLGTLLLSLDLIKKEIRQLIWKSTADQEEQSVLIRQKDLICALEELKQALEEKKATGEQVVKHLTNYFKKLKKVVDENRENIPYEVV